MDISKANKDEVRYQHRNYAKHVEISALFGWGALDKFYLPENLDHATPRRWPATAWAALKAASSECQKRRVPT